MLLQLQTVTKSNYTFSHTPDLIVMDMMLPGLDGIEVCQEI